MNNNTKSNATMGKHTPLPWRVGMNPGPMIYGPKGEQVCDMFEPMVFDDENKANAALIVHRVNSHCQMLQALKDARELIAIYGQMDSVIQKPVMNLKKIDAAIATATTQR